MFIKASKGIVGFFGVIPLMVVPFVVYVIAGLVGPIDDYNSPFFTLALPSGAVSYVTVGHGITLLGAAALTLEWAKSADTSTKGIIDSVLSVLLAIAFMLLYILMPQFGSATFLVLVALQMCDGIGGIVTPIVSGRRDFGLGN